ncbi:uncharacterized protein LOC106535379 [Austrofundulus limnaeus]|uniref:Uncharacterized protein LOC106535379 n=1 Tax=Austrofundulus limnaeus TaxID=52670 RepID=A0A2I4D6G7_AUSLI|nr:PREDICTED: uncharacterized protein LOC106535379 [Austrofundulus limnaeus]
MLMYGPGGNPSQAAFKTTARRAPRSSRSAFFRAKPPMGHTRERDGGEGPEWIGCYDNHSTTGACASSLRAQLRLGTHLSYGQVDEALDKNGTQVTVCNQASPFQQDPGDPLVVSSAGSRSSSRASGTLKQGSNFQSSKREGIRGILFPIFPCSKKQMLTCVQKGDWFTSVDLKDAYFHVPVIPAHRKYLLFSFQQTQYQYNRLPFRLRTGTTHLLNMRRDSTAASTLSGNENPVLSGRFAPAGSIQTGSSVTDG